jgi:hypothetical protein
MYLRLKHIIAERWTSKNYHLAWMWAALSALAFQFGYFTASATCLNNARLRYRTFFEECHGDFLAGLENFPAVNKFMTVLASKNPTTGVEETRTVWVKANTYAEALKRVAAGGDLVRIIHMSGGDMKAELIKDAPGIIAMVTAAMKQTWLHEPTPPPVAQGNDAPPSTALVQSVPLSSPSTISGGRGVLKAVIEGAPVLRPKPAPETLPNRIAFGKPVDFIGFQFRKDGDPLLYRENLEVAWPASTEPMAASILANLAVGALYIKKPHLKEVIIHPESFRITDSTGAYAESSGEISLKG